MACYTAKSHLVDLPNRNTILGLAVRKHHPASFLGKMIPLLVNKGGKKAETICSSCPFLPLSTICLSFCFRDASWIVLEIRIDGKSFTDRARTMLSANELRNTAGLETFSLYSVATWMDKIFLGRRPHVMTNQASRSKALFSTYGTSTTVSTLHLVKASIGRDFGRKLAAIAPIYEFLSQYFINRIPFNTSALFSPLLRPICGEYAWSKQNYCSGKRHLGSRSALSAQSWGLRGVGRIAAVTTLFMDVFAHLYRCFHEDQSRVSPTWPTLMLSCSLIPLW